MLFWPVPLSGGGPTSADWMTAWGTLGTAVVAVAALLVTMWLAWRDRQRDEAIRNEEKKRHDDELDAERDRHERERAEDLARYERGLAEERERSERDRADAERRLKDEREHAEKVRQHDRREAAVDGLLGRIAGLMPFFESVPGLNWAVAVGTTPSPFGAPDYSPERASRLLEVQAAVRSLAYGGHAEVWGLGDEQAVNQYRKLVHLVESATGDSVPTELHERAAKDLRRYALFVRVSLESLTRTGASLDPGLPPWPDLRRVPTDDALWQPANLPPEWHMAIMQERGDPAYLAAH